MMNSSSEMPKGKYLKEPFKRTGRKRKNCLTVGLSCIAIILAVMLGVMVWGLQNRSIYQSIVQEGYTGTQEQWLASLVGEETDHSDGAKTSYELAVKNGYKGSRAEWLQTLTGYTDDDINTSPYTLACKKGFEGSLTEWLTEIADKPEKLGVSHVESPKTEYELACDYGYSGTFIEWLVSITHDRVFK